MSESRRKFTAKERLSIVHEGEREGRIETIRKYSIPHPLCMTAGARSIFQKVLLD